MPKIELPVFPTEESITFYPSMAAYKKGESQKKSISEIEHIFQEHRHLERFKWTNNPVVESNGAIPDDKELTFTGFNFKSARFAQEIPPKKMQVDTSSLAIVYFGKKIGYGVIAIKPISKFQWLLFNGETKKLTEEEMTVYMDNNPYISAIPDTLRGGTILFDTRSVGGYSSLILASPNTSYLAELKEQNIDNLSDVGEANFVGKLVKINGEVQIGLLACRDIEPGEVLLSDYGKTYFMQFVGSFAVLNKDGTLASAEIQTLVNKKACEFVLNRNTDTKLDKSIIEIQSRINKKQFDYKDTYAPRIFYKWETFVVYPDVCDDLLELAHTMVEKGNNVEAKDVLCLADAINQKFTSNLNHREAVAEQINDLQLSMWHLMP
ncbi:SET domain-containing protein [Legionella brunensis]|uniref:SET domain-containing protein n=1 Tax=Legionella brunensis TaxID=29422 RepID=A0A0W0SEI8_9GAMM|nr:SET domain-containing protein [Legionella brunensis]KTC81577.1 hypothetical protein Lbru_2097 [Legionella brunensis]